MNRVRTERSSLQSRLKEIQRHLKARHEIMERKRSIEEYCRRARKNIDGFAFEQKSLVLDALNIRVLIEGKRVAVSGVIPTRFGVRTPSFVRG